jgi:hypothetical protein
VGAPDRPDRDALDEQIDWLRAGLRAAEPGSEPDRDLDAAIRHARNGLADLPCQPDDEFGAAGADTAAAGISAELRLILGLGLADQFAAEQERLAAGTEGDVVSARSCRDEAIAVLTRIIGELPAAGPASIAVADALGRALHDRYADPWPGAAKSDPVDLDRPSICCWPP